MKIWLKQKIHLKKPRFRWSKIDPSFGFTKTLKHLILDTFRHPNLALKSAMYLLQKSQIGSLDDQLSNVGDAMWFRLKLSSNFHSTSAKFARIQTFNHYCNFLKTSCFLKKCLISNKIDQNCHFLNKDYDQNQTFLKKLVKIIQGWQFCLDWGRESIANLQRYTFIFCSFNHPCVWTGQITFLVILKS